MSTWPEPVTLTGTYVTVTPLSHGHHDDLVEATADGDFDPGFCEVDRDGLANAGSASGYECCFLI